MGASSVWLSVGLSKRPPKRKISLRALLDVAPILFASEGSSPTLVPALQNSRGSKPLDSGLDLIIQGT